jgi:hypothetical protein
MKRTIHIIVLGMLALSSCKNIQKMVDKGEYDEAIIYAAEKLQGDEDRKTRYVTALEDAFERVMAQDFRRLEQLKERERSEDYGKIYQLYHKIERRQSRIRPFLPLISEDGYVAHFKMIDTRPMIKEYAEKDAAYLYEKAEDYLDAYTPEEKHLARNAYRALENIERYFRDYKEKEALMREARRLGTEHVYVNSEVSPYILLDRDSRAMITDLNINGMNGEWVAFHNIIHEDMTYDYKVTLAVQDMLIEPGRENAHTFHYEKEIQDGWNYLLDERGNVAKDTLGNDIKIPNYITVRAEVTEVERFKAVRIVSDLIVEDLHTGREISRKEIDSDIVFNGFSCFLRGDKRAINGINRKHRMDGFLEPFPYDEEMVLAAMDKITRSARNKMRKHFL